MAVVRRQAVLLRALRPAEGHRGREVAELAGTERVGMVVLLDGLEEGVGGTEGVEGAAGEGRRWGEGPGGVPGHGDARGSVAVAGRFGWWGEGGGFEGREEEATEEYEVVGWEVQEEDAGRGVGGVGKGGDGTGM